MLSSSKSSQVEKKSDLAFMQEKFFGWGRYPVLAGKAFEPDTMQAAIACFNDGSADSPILARGLGRSYGDAAISSDADLLLTPKLDRMLAFDEASGILRCEPGVSFDDLLRTFLRRGWFPPVSPGTKYVTMGGALASDIHGKNHHKDGSFVDFVKSFHLLGARNELIRCSREENSELFWATAGGMGLTGFIKDIEIQLKAVESPALLVKKIRCCNLSDTCKLIEESEAAYEYSVCWIDCLAGGKDLGRSILILGKHASASECSKFASNNVAMSEAARAQKGLPVPMDMPSWLLNRYSIAAFNTAYYHLSSGSGEEQIAHFNSFFYPLDFLSDWNRMYGRNGFIQYQCVLPLAASKAGLEEILALSSKRGRSSFLAVLKKFGAGHGYLSFPMPGYTLTLDMPVKPGLFDFTRELDEIVLKHGGRVYLAKDACLSADSFRHMYPELSNWQKVKTAIDPKNRFRSALSQRLKL